jgi:hypothetical protein
MRHLLFLLALLLPLAAAAETSPTLKLAPTVVAVVGTRSILTSDGDLRENELANARQRYAPAKLEEILTKMRRQKMATALVAAITNHYVQAKGVEVTDAEVEAWVKSVRAKGDENRNRDIAKYEAELKAKEAEITAAAGDMTKLNQLSTEKLKMEGTLNALREAFKMDEKLAQLYPGMGLLYLQTWKSRRELVNEFGGKVYELNGSYEPLDALDALIRKLTAEGTFAVKDPYAAEILKEYLDRRETLRAISPEEGKKLLNDKNW